ncbi:hypothetical protein D1872_230930 [compost metagenome]
MTWLGFEQGYLAPTYGNVRISQLLALLIIAAAIVLIIVRRRTVKDLPRYGDPIVSTRSREVESLASAAPSEQSAEGLNTKEEHTPNEPEKSQAPKE